MAIKRPFRLVPTIALVNFVIVSSARICKDSFVMVCYFSFYVGHARVAYLQGVVVEYLRSGWFCLKQFLTIDKNFLPTLVATYLLYGGWNHVMLRSLFFALLSEYGFTFSYLSVYSYPLLRNACWKTGAASSKDSLLDEISLRRRFTASGMFLRISGKCLLSLCT